MIVKRIGIGLFYGWYYAALSADTLLRLKDFELLIAAGFALSFVIQFLPRVSSLSFRGFGFAEAAGLLCAAFSLVGFFPYAPAWVVPQAFCAGLSSLFIPVVFTSQSKALTGLNASEIAFGIVLSISIAKSLSFVSQAASILAWAVVVMVPILLTWSCYRHSRQSDDSPVYTSLIKKSDGEYARWEARGTIVGIVFLSTIFIALQRFSVAVDHPEILSPSVQMSLLVAIEAWVVCAWFASAGRRKKSKDFFNALVRVTFILLPFGSVLVLADVTSLCALGLSLLILAQEYLVCLLWVLMPSIDVGGRTTNPARLFGWTFLLQFMSLAAGHAIIDQLTSSSFGGLTISSIVAILSILLFILVRTYFVNDEQIASALKELDSAIERAALRDEGRVDEFSKAIGLSPREKEVFSLWIKGVSSREIAQILVLSNETVKTHVKHIYRKAGVSGRKALTEAVESSPLTKMCENKDETSIR